MRHKLFSCSNFRIWNYVRRTEGMDRFGIHKDPGHNCRICDVIHFLFCTTGGPKGLVSFLAVCCVIKKDVKQERAIKYRPSISWKQGFHQPENKQFEENHGCWCQKHVRPPLLAFHKAIQKYFCFDDKAKISGSLSVWAVRGWRGRDRNERSIILPVNNLQTILRTHQYCCCLFQHAILHRL